MSKKNTKVSIVGWAANTRGHAPFDDDTWDIWGCNEVGMSGMPGKRFTAHYNLHTPKELNKEQFAPNMEWLRGRSEPVWILPGCEALVPNAKVYPVADMFAKYGKYFTNSISYMLVHAIEQGYKNIALYGIDMAMDSEYQYQRPCVEYYIGLARGMGIVVDIPPDSAILSFPWIYGVQDAPTTEGIVSEATLREKGRELEVQFKKDQESAPRRTANE